MSIPPDGSWSAYEPGPAPADLPEPTRVVVDGHVFLVRADPDQWGVHHVDWLTGTPDYGFTIGRSGGGPLSPAEAEDAVRDFLAGTDPATGHLAD